MNRNIAVRALVPPFWPFVWFLGEGHFEQERVTTRLPSSPSRLPIFNLATSIVVDPAFYYFPRSRTPPPSSPLHPRRVSPLRPLHRRPFQAIGAYRGVADLSLI